MNYDKLNNAQLENLILSLPSDSRRRAEAEIELNRRYETYATWAELRQEQKLMSAVHITAGIRFQFDRQHESAADALEQLIRTATRELERLQDSEYRPAVDFVSQHATKYAAAVEQMNATSSALSVALHFAEQP